MPERVCTHYLMCAFLEEKSRSFDFLEKMIRSYRIWSLENEEQFRNVLIWEVAPLICIRISLLKMVRTNDNVKCKS